jgi:NitT/TauT family transport system permease protein
MRHSWWRTGHNFALRWSAVVGIALLWEAASRSHWIDPVFAPPLSIVLLTIGRLFVSGALLTHIGISSLRALLGLTLALLVGVPSGVLLGYVAPRLHAVVAPLLRVLSQVNPFSLMPVFLLFFGSGELVKITTVGWVALWPIVFYTVTAVTTVEPALTKAGRAMALSPFELVTKVILPAAVPTLFVGLRIAGGLVFFMLVAAEMLGTNGGLGWLVHNSAMNYRIPGIYAGALVVTVLGYALHLGLLALERRVFVRVGAELPTARRSRSTLSLVKAPPAALPRMSTAFVRASTEEWT